MKLTAEWRADTGRTDADITGATAQWKADLDTSAGGSGDLPSPHELLDSALAACTVLTLQIYAKRRGYPLEAVRAEVSHEETATDYRLRRTVVLEGPLEEAQRQDLLRVANACPIHKALHKQFDVATKLG